MKIQGARRGGRRSRSPGRKPPRKGSGRMRDVCKQGKGDIGAGERNRTPDPLITNQLLYRLSYASISKNDPCGQLTAPKADGPHSLLRKPFPRRNSGKQLNPDFSPRSAAATSAAESPGCSHFVLLNIPPGMPASVCTPCTLDLQPLTLPRDDRGKKSGVKAQSKPGWRTLHLEPPRPTTRKQ